MPDTLLRWIVNGTFTNDSRIYHTLKFRGFQDHKVQDSFISPISYQNWNSKPVSLDFSRQKTRNVIFLRSLKNPVLLQTPFHSTHESTTHSFELTTHYIAGVNNRIDTRITFLSIKSLMRLDTYFEPGRDEQIRYLSSSRITKRPLPVPAQAENK